LLAQRKRSHRSDNANRSQISIHPQLAELGAEAVVNCRDTRYEDVTSRVAALSRAMRQAPIGAALI
jgi:hypothetical protein